MNSASNDNQAATKAVRIARAALRGALACALVFGAGTAFAQQQYGDRYGGERRDDMQQQQMRQQGGRERFSLPPQDRGREADMRAYDDARRQQEDARRQQEQQQPPQYAQPQRDERRGSGRLTPDERRDLRRQINEAGMDLYPRRR